MASNVQLHETPLTTCDRIAGRVYGHVYIRSCVKQMEPPSLRIRDYLPPKVKHALKPLQ
jgi:hypothetical protein